MNQPHPQPTDTTITIANRTIGKGNPCFIIAEAGVNHNGSLDLAKKLVDAAVEAGADAVKFQTFKTEDIVTEEAEQAAYQKENTGKSESQYAMLKRLELSEEDHKELAHYCAQKELIFSSTPHSSIRDADFLATLGVSFYKIGSGDLTNLPFLHALAQTGTPLIVSTGMGNEEEIKEAYETIKNVGKSPVVFLQCTTSYPCPSELANVKGIDTLQKTIPVPIGYSDHTTSLAPGALAAALGACVIEKHFTLNKNMEGPDHKASLDPAELKKYVELVRFVEKEKMPVENVYSIIQQEKGINLESTPATFLGNGSLAPFEEELAIAKVARKSVVAAQDTPTGTVLTDKHIAFKRPGTGLSPKYAYGKHNVILGKTTKTTIKKNTAVTLEMLGDAPIQTPWKVLYVSGSRADYGLMRHTLQAIQKHPSLSLHIAVTGMHLMEEFGKTEQEITHDQIPFTVLDAKYTKDDKKSMALFLGDFTQKLTQFMYEHTPDVVLLLGDRAEMLAGATVAAYLGIPVAHIHGGDVSSTVDDTVRHAITKLSHIHFAATEQSAQRIKNMGENPQHVFVSGAPGLDNPTKELTPTETDQLLQKYGVTQQFILVLQHPVSAEDGDAGRQMRETMEAVMASHVPAVVVYPNADAGGRAMIAVIEEYRGKENISIHKHIPRKDFLGLLASASVLVGNSSAGIIESPSFKLPVINIGTRQQGRERSNNVLDVTYDQHAIKATITQAMSFEFKEHVKTCENPYQKNIACEIIPEKLASIALTSMLLQKRIV